MKKDTPTYIRLPKYLHDMALAEGQKHMRELAAQINWHISHSLWVLKMRGIHPEFNADWFKKQGKKGK